MPKKYLEKARKLQRNLGLSCVVWTLLLRPKVVLLLGDDGDKMGVAGCLQVTDALSCDNGARI